VVEYDSILLLIFQRIKSTFTTSNEGTLVEIRGKRSRDLEEEFDGIVKNRDNDRSPNTGWPTGNQARPHSIIWPPSSSYKSSWNGVAVQNDDNSCCGRVLKLVLSLLVVFCIYEFLIHRLIDLQRK
jgi:hypothetical protein